MLSSTLKWCACLDWVSFWTWGLNGSSPMFRHWLPIHQMLRSTASNKNLTFCIRAMFGGFDESLMSSFKVGADDIIRQPLKASTIREVIRRALVHPRN